ncbi:PD40 domain-containing protein [Rugosimonospora acidiphila]|uniref:PD40 domain-containing protein n=1 Tax=Rugosimonospora acidiphila TaxID=556531 RepID=A0ABP9RQY9_9ACTN
MTSPADPTAGEPGSGGNQRLRLAILAAITAVAVAVAVGYVVYAHGQRAEASAKGPKTATTSLAAVSSGPHVVFRSTALGSGYGHIAVASLSNPDGPRAITPTSCDRVYAGRASALCLVADRGMVTTYRALTLGPDWQTVGQAPLPGLPSRARMSPDGSLNVTTTFVYGDSYTNPGQFSTRTLIAHTDGQQIADLEQFTLVIDGRRVTAADRNFWGVTFADDDTFYATAATGGHTWLVRGSIAQRRMVSIREDVECPSLSPDKTRIAFKKHGDLPAGHWRLAVYDLTTGKETLLAEPRSVDDQVEWLDNDHVLYGLPRIGAAAATQDVWVVPADGTGSARVFVHNAWSPSVVR